MIQIPLGKALAHEVEGFEVEGIMQGYTLYLVRDEEIVLYVGQSWNPLSRLYKHLYGNQGWPTRLGGLIQANKPESMQWTCELREPGECFEYVQAYYTAIYQDHPDILRIMLGTFLIKPDVDDAEIALIRHFKPCLNGAVNPHETPLPEKYRRGLTL